MIKIIHPILLIICGFTLFTSCQKELNFPDTNTNTPGTSGGTAVYTFSGGTGSCSGTIINGTYNKGTELNVSNTVVIKVNVDTVGTYSIATANINGVIFGASGTFTTTGAQSIKLTGVGTPLASGNFVFVPGAKGCSFAISFTANGTNNGTAQFLLTGAPGDCTTPVVNGNYIAGTALDASNTIVLKVNVANPGSYSIATNAINGIIFSATGTFSATGQNTILMAGTGKPAAAGIFTFIPGANGCKFVIDCK